MVGTASALALLLGTVALTAPAFPASAQTQPSAAAPRVETDLSRGWKFRFGASDADGPRPGFDDTDWQTVDVPHTWNKVGAEGTSRPADSDNRQGVAWYRLHLTAPPAGRGSRQYLDFAGVSNIAELWVNGTRIGEHRGGYTRFRFDVTSAWRPDGDNLIAVRADNAKPAPGSSTVDVLPLSGDFFIFGGIYRGVRLVTAGPVGFDLLDHGGPGIYAHTAAIGGGQATVEIVSRLRSSAARAVRMTAVATIADADGREVARTTAPVGVAGSSTAELRQRLVVRSPRLWNGRADPYRYAVTVALFDGARLVDRVTQPLGIRSIRVDADRGFFLNGKPLPLHGVSRHQDWQGKGYALTRADHAADMKLIAEMGANSVRGAHYPHADEWFDEADAAGMVMWAEVPYVSASSFDGTDGTPATFANAKTQMTELIRQQYNHPSIAMWSVGNEVDASVLFLKTAKMARGLALLETLDGLTRKEDPTRPTVFADCCEDTPFGRPGAQVLTGVTELLGYNRYYGWYYGTPADNGPELDKLHAKHPGKPLSVSEYGAGGALTQHSDNPQGGPVAAFGRPHPEEYQSWYHEQAWKAFKARPYIFGTWVWNMFDFASDLREEGDSIDLNDKGLVSYDRATRKDAFFFYKANWSTDPLIHLTGKRYVDRAYPVIDVRAYSNADSARLTLNGTPVGTVPCPDRICVWTNVALAPGGNLARVDATVAGQAVSDEARWTAPDARDGLRIRAGTLTGMTAADGRRFGSDNWFAGGNAVTLNPQIPGMRLPVKRVENAADRALFDSYRTGPARYRLPLPDGRWTLVIHSFEPDTAAAATRTFGVRVDGMMVADRFSPAKAAGGALRATMLRIPVTVHGGMLALDFIEQGGAPIVAAIEVVR
jgi:beta-galactosidase